MQQRSERKHRVRATIEFVLIRNLSSSSIGIVLQRANSRGGSDDCLLPGPKYRNSLGYLHRILAPKNNIIPAELLNIEIDF